MFTYLHAIVIGAVLLQVPATAQVPARVRALQELAEPPVPSDPLELVTGNAQPAQDVNQRAEIITLLENAHKHSNVRAQPYDLKTTFTVTGSLSPGVWQMEDTSPGANLYRWTVQGPSYSAVNLSANHIFYSSQPATGLPLRLVQAREAIFYAKPLVGPRATLRTANASLNGADLLCALIAHNAMSPAGTGGRLWEEEEYCVDSKAGTLVTYSPAPGSYIVYDYSKAVPFHGKLIPNGFTITQAGQTIVEAQTESVTAPANNPAAFQPAGLNQIGVGAVMSGTWRSRTRMPLPGGPQAAVAQTTAPVVVLHGMQAPNGKVSDLEMVASSDPSLNESALAFATQWQGGMLGQQPDTGATPQSHEFMMLIQYFNMQPLISQQ
ncbi:MAG: hypothetical protein ABSG13_26470 [Bryobacteraceae bacterium]